MPALAPEAIRELCAKQDLTRLRAVSLALAPVVLGHVAWFGLWAASAPTPEGALWRRLVFLINSSVLVALSALCAAAWGAWRNLDAPLGWRARLPAAFGLLFLCATAASAVADQLVTSAITPFIIATLGVAITLRLSTRAVAWCYGVGLVTLEVGVQLTQRLPDARLSAMLNGFTTTAVGVALSITLTRALERAERARLTIEVQRREIEKLRGFLRVCSYCKRIHNERQAWEPLDSYLARSSGASVTHGMCEDCFEQRFGPDDGS